MNITDIANMVSTKLSDTEALTTDLIVSGKQFISDMKSVLESKFLPNISIDTTPGFKPTEQILPTAPSVPSSSATLPAEPPALVLHDYTAADPIDTSAASDFGDLPAPSGDLGVSNGEDNGSLSRSIADKFIDAVKVQIQNANFDKGYASSVQSGMSSRSQYISTTISQVTGRLSYMGVQTPSDELKTFMGYQSVDDTRFLSSKQEESSVENDKNMVEVAVKLAQMLYQNADAIYSRALDVSKSIIEFGNAVYQLQIGIERSASGVAAIAMNADFDMVDSEESINKLNLKSRKENARSFSEVSDTVIQSIENLNAQYDAKVSKYGIDVARLRAIAEFDSSKSTLSERALAERVNITIQNVVDAIDAFVTVTHHKRIATMAGEGVFSEAINGAIEGRNTLVSIGKKDLTTAAGA